MLFRGWMVRAIFCAFVVLIASFGAAPAVSGAVVKLSKSGICHSSESPYFYKTKTFTPFSSVEGCLAAGGRLPHQRNAQSPDDDAKPKEYDRSHFGDWIDADSDCQNTRHEVLALQSTVPPVWSPNGCRVLHGRWISAYTGDVHSDASRLDIDHVVPLAWAWMHGASQWPKAKRIKFANDPANLLPVEASLNRSKGALGLNDWLPPKNKCQYAARFHRIARLYGLDASDLPSPQTYCNQ